MRFKFLSSKKINQKIDNLIKDKSFFDYFGRYILANNQFVEELAIKPGDSNISTVFLLLLGDAFFKMQNGKNGYIGAKILYCNKFFTGEEKDFFCNKELAQNEGCILTSINKEFNHSNSGEISNLFCYFSKYANVHNQVKGVQRSVIHVLDIYEHLEYVENPIHIVHPREEKTLIEKLTEMHSSIVRNNISFKNFYRFYYRHKFYLKIVHFHSIIKEKVHKLYNICKKTQRKFLQKKSNSLL